ncbi:SymE family type I addiction module toxin [Erwinia sp. AnSW2-5]|uniref:SymE family type I addiction module toxin n=1 Tax=Erwinia sp. AnSW2-5 TaxID=3367692 RepID=UPI003858B3A9
MNVKCLEEAGFATGTKVDIRVMKGCLVIAARAPEGQDKCITTFTLTEPHTTL